MRRSCCVGVVGLVVAVSLARAEEEYREVSFQSADGGRVFAHLYGDGEHAVVLAHGAVFNKESWHALSLRLADEGHRVLAIDFRGYGKSQAGSQGRALDQDILGAVRYLRAAGARRVSVVGASMGGGAAATAATKSAEGDLDRLILLAGVPIAAAERIRGNKLFIVSRGDGLRDRVRQQFDAAPPPKELVVLEGDAHAQHIFKTEHAEELTQRIVDWLAD